MGCLMYALFDSIETFDAWHEEVKKTLGIPDAFGTTNYTLPTDSVLEGSSAVWAYVDNDIDTTGLDLYSRADLIALGYYRELVLPE